MVCLEMDDVAVIVLHVLSIRLQHLAEIAPKLLQDISVASPGRVTIVSYPKFDSYETGLTFFEGIDRRKAYIAGFDFPKRV